MGTISSAFHLISGALNADQSALAIVANNVANANTPGYSEQTPTWRENDPVSINNVNYGNGVSQTGPTSVRDRVLLERLDQQQQLAGVYVEINIVQRVHLRRAHAKQFRHATQASCMRTVFCFAPISHGTPPPVQVSLLCEC